MYQLPLLFASGHENSRRCADQVAPTITTHPSYSDICKGRYTMAGWLVGWLVWVGGWLRGGRMRKRSPTRSKIIKDLQSETTAVSDHVQSACYCVNGPAPRHNQPPA